MSLESHLENAKYLMNNETNKIIPLELYLVLNLNDGTHYLSTILFQVLSKSANIFSSAVGF